MVKNPDEAKCDTCFVFNALNNAPCIYQLLCLLNCWIHILVEFTLINELKWVLYIYSFYMQHYKYTLCTLIIECIIYIAFRFQIYLYWSMELLHVYIGVNPIWGVLWGTISHHALLILLLNTGSHMRARTLFYTHTHADTHAHVHTYTRAHSFTHNYTHIAYTHTHILGLS